MPNSVPKRRTRVALLATVAMLASIFVIPATAQAKTGDVEKPAKWSACVDAATADAGFADTAGSFADAAIDCIKHYGITTGTSATQYSPGQNVPRWQMALFLVRAAGPAGLTVPAATDQGFTDIGGFPQATQDAINQIAAMGISKGTNAAGTTFSPNDTVSRYQMALFLNRFLGKANVKCDATCDDASGFTDTGSVSFEAYNAIEDVYDFGVTKGTTTTTFAPYAAVNREQMAAFISRTLAHTNARPAGVSLQAVPTSGFGDFNVDVQVAVRDANHAPVANALVDIFSKSVDTGTDLVPPLKADGTCDGTQTGDCTISLADPVTNADGLINLAAVAITSGKTIQWWAWTGSSGDKFDADTVTPGTDTVSSAPGALSTVVTWNLPENAQVSAGRTTAKFGTVTYTFQLNSKADGTGSNVAQSGVTITYDYTLTQGAAVEAKVGQTVKTDANGSATVSFTVTDPNTATGDSATLDFNVAGQSGALVLDMADEDVAMTDAAAAATSVVVASATKYVVLSGTNTGTNSVTATVYDQYGIGKNNENVTLDSDQAASTLQNLVRVTSGNGSATQGYSWSGAAAAETLSVAEFGGDSVIVHWVVTGTTGVVGATVIDVADKANDTIVAGGATWKYDANDQFNVTGTGAVSMAAFEAALAADGADTIAVNYQASASGISVWTFTDN